MYSYAFKLDIGSWSIWQIYLIIYYDQLYHYLMELVFLNLISSPIASRYSEFYH